MMPNTGNYVFAYDISLTKERNKVDKVLKEYGFRIQKSVFECVLTENDREKLLNRLNELGLNSGFVKVYRQDSYFKAKTVGPAPEKQDTGFAYFAA